jgi:3-methyl-2-oxobutanoate hydroxymethyltransferase
MTTEGRTSPAPGATSPGTPEETEETRTPRAPRLTAPGLRALKGRRKIAALTAYDAPTAALLDAAGVDLLLVGDSIEMVVYGAPDTLGASLDRMVAHARAVSGAAKRALVVGDLPYLTYHTTPEDAVRNAARFVVEGGCRAVKLEGGSQRLPMVKAILAAEIPVLGHLGLTPQSVHALGGFRVQGRRASEARRLLDEAKRLVDAGVFGLVLECVPAEVAAKVTEAVPVPTIGIGAGAGCDGQILVFHDLVGLTVPGARAPRFVRRYADLGAIVREAASAYVADVRGGTFPSEAESFAADAPEAGPVPLYAAGEGRR